MRGSDFDCIGRTRAVHEGTTEAENETACNELVNMSGGGDNCSPDANDQATHEHADTATEVVPGRGEGQCGTRFRKVVVRAGASEERPNNSTNHVHGEDNTSSWILVLTNTDRSPTENGHTLAEVSAVGKALNIRLHTVDASPEKVGVVISQANTKGRARLT